MAQYAKEEAHTFAEFLELVSRLKPGWCFRGLASNHDLSTTLERALGRWSVELEEAPNVERELVREFRRGYRGDDWSLVMNDTLYCLSVMQHYGAPTRLLDWTYSPYVAAKFAYASAPKPEMTAVVWCLNAKWIEVEASNVADPAVLARWNDKRTEDDFVSLFQSPHPSSFVYTANPCRLNERLKVQQGLFICQSNITRGFPETLSYLNGSEIMESVFKIALPSEMGPRTEFFEELRRMNVSFASLYPGLSGYAQSLGDYIYSYKNSGR
jgi:hypothetical protein